MKSAMFSCAALLIAATSGSRIALAQPPPPGPPPLLEVYGTIVPWLELGQTTGATEPGSVIQGSTGASR